MERINRRKFLEFTSLLAGTSVMATHMPWFNVFNNPAQASSNPSDRVRLGFIGVGSRGSTLMQNVLVFKDQKNVDIVAVCDNYGPHLERAIELSGGAEGFYDYREMLDKVDLDGVVIATPIDEHVGPSVYAMQAGCHVYCEKTFARHLDDVKLMYDTHLEENKVLQVGHQRLFDPVYPAAIKMIEEGKIGQVTMVRGVRSRNSEWIFYDVPGGRGTELDRRRNWRLYRDVSGGMIAELGAHDFQSVNWMMGTPPVSVMGRGSTNYWKSREVWDNYTVIFEYPGGIQFSYDNMDTNVNSGRQLQVLGNQGTLDVHDNRFFYEDPPPPPALETLLDDLGSNLFGTIPIGGATWVAPEGQTVPDGNISDTEEVQTTLLALEGFVEFIRKGEAPEKLVHEGYNVAIWTLLAEQATLTRELVTIPEKYVLKS